MIFDFLTSPQGHQLDPKVNKECHSHVKNAPKGIGQA